MQSLCLPRWSLQPANPQICPGRCGITCTSHAPSLTAGRMQTEISRTWSQMDHVAVAHGAKHVSNVSHVAQAVRAPGAVCCCVLLCVALTRRNVRPGTSVLPSTAAALAALRRRARGALPARVQVLVRLRRGELLRRRRSPPDHYAGDRLVAPRRGLFENLAPAPVIVMCCLRQKGLVQRATAPAPARRAVQSQPRAPFPTRFRRGVCGCIVALARGSVAVPVLPMTAEDAQWGDASDAPRRGSRAARSLGLLCSRFLELYASHTCGESHLSLDHAAASLGVERRRMYDVVGILEACEVVVRRGKNSYTCAPLRAGPTAGARRAAKRIYASRQNWPSLPTDSPTLPQVVRPHAASAGAG